MSLGLVFSARFCSTHVLSLVAHLCRSLIMLFCPRRACDIHVRSCASQQQDGTTAASAASPRGLVTVGSVAAAATTDPSPLSPSTETDTSALKAEALAKHQAVLTQLQVRAYPCCAFLLTCERVGHGGIRFIGRRQHPTNTS